MFLDWKSVSAKCKAVGSSSSRDLQPRESWRWL